MDYDLGLSSQIRDREESKGYGSKMTIPVRYDTLKNGDFLYTNFETTPPSENMRNGILEKLDLESRSATIKNDKFTGLNKILSHQKALDVKQVYSNWVKKTMSHGDFRNLTICLLEKDYAEYSRLEMQIIEKIRNESSKKKARDHVRQKLTRSLFNYSIDESTKANLVMYFSTLTCDYHQSSGSESHEQCYFFNALLKNLTDENRQVLFRLGFEKNLYTPLHYAGMFASPCILTVLLSQGADPNILDCDLKTPLSYALNYQNSTKAKVLFLHGADPHLGLNTENTSSLYKCEKVLVHKKKITDRIVEIENVFNYHCTTYLRHFNVKKLLSKVHIVRGCLFTEKFKENVALTEHMKLTQIREFPLSLPDFAPHLNKKNNSFRIRLLVIIPFNFTNDGVINDIDCFAGTPIRLKRLRAAEGSQAGISDVAVFGSDPILTLPTFEIKHQASLKEISLKPIIRERNNGYIYAFEIPNDVKQVSTLQLHLNNLQEVIADAYALSFMVGVVLMEISC
uniref:ANK_REP_REGION domain-containing protein n=1 Tax=Rhabditophanes sp. KR3021 TaxID=114890 RepID=A0AC35UB91_9BILA